MRNTMNGRPSIPYLRTVTTFAFAVLLSLSGVSHADKNVSVATGDSLRVIELFTSHGCSSCPPADLLLGELLKTDEKLLALEYHVDYWNSLIHGSAGSFVDPYSNSAYSKRQREYSATKLRGRPGVYTPQAIINGTVASVGSNRRHIAKALKKNVLSQFGITLEPVSDDDSILKVQVTGSTQKLREFKGIDVQLARYIDTASTNITGGENQNLTLENHHIVFDLTRLGQISEESDMVYNIAAPKEGEGCVILVQEDALTPIYAALECP